MNSTLPVLLLSFALVSLAQGDPAKLDFNRQIRPILADNCFECHGPDKEARKAKLRMDTRDGLFAKRDEPLIVAGQPAESELVARLTSQDPEEVMPPPKAQRHPTPAQIDLVKRWIAEGADYAEHWAFVPPRRRSLPALSDAAWCRSDLDREVMAKLDAEGLKPQPEAPPGILARRLSLTLTGLPPTTDEMDRFAKDYAANPDAAVSSWVDHLLASPHYGEHMAWAWMDAARYADTNGYQADSPRSMWRWRDWLVAALNRNLPFDRMTEEMIAGDLLMPAAARTWESGDVIRDPAAGDLLLATGFLRNHRFDSGSGTIPEESKFENATDRMETVGTVWLGLTLHCARCHDHKFDPVSSREFYRMLSFFDKVPEVGSALETGASHPYIHAPTESQRAELAKHDARVAAAKAALAAAEETIVAAQARWEREIVSANASLPPVTRGLKFEFATKESEPELKQLSDAITMERGPRPGLMAWRFDGETALEAPAKPLELCKGDARWTVSFWVKPEHGGDMAIISSVASPDRGREGFQFDVAGGRLRLRHVHRWLNSYEEFTSNERLPIGVWSHVALACDGRMQGVGYRAWLNGDAAAMTCTQPVSNDASNNAPSAPLVFGANPYLPKFDGALAELRIYERRLDADEIAFLSDRRPVAAIAAIPPDQRSDAERSHLRHAFLENAADDSTKALQQTMFDAEDARRAFIRSLPTTMVMQEAAGRQTFTRIKGSYDKLGDAVESGVPAVLPPLAGDAPADRVALAHWLTSPANPLTARVSVNRIWQQLWGRGFVDTPDNFGTQCAEPLHAELLDWLALEYIRLGWDTKALVKLIVTSATFRQNSAAPPAAWQRDPDNRLLARGPRYRLPIGVVRDQALFIGGLLQPEIGGPPVRLEKAEVKPEKPGKRKAPELEVSTQRRTLYAFWKRNAPHPLLAVFDTADRNQCDVRVRRTNTPLQSLVTLNEPSLVECARGLAKRIAACSGDDETKMSWAFRTTTGRAPAPEEKQRLLEALDAYREHFADEPAADELGGKDADAAWTTLANVLLNLDATLTLE